MNLQVAEDMGGSIVFDPTEIGRPSAATVTLRDSSGVQLQASTAATIDAVNTTLSSAAAAGDTSVVLTAVTGVVRGRSYQLSNGTNFTEWARVRAINASTKRVTLDAPLGYDYASGSGSTFIGNRLSYTTTPTHAADRQKNCDAVWSFTIASVVYYGRSFWDVVRSVIPVVILRTDQFRQYAGARGARVREELEKAGDSFEDAIAFAQEDMLTDIRQRELELDRIRNWEAFKKAVAYRVVLNRAAMATGIPQVYLQTPKVWTDERRLEYLEALTEALEACNYDADDSGVVDKNEAALELGTIRVDR